jgi:hypothetical protein
MVIHTIQRQFQPVGHTEFIVHFAQVILHNLLGSPDSQGNFLVRHPLHQAGNKQTLFWRELHFRRGFGSGAVLVTLRFQHPANCLGIEPAFARYDLPQAIHHKFRLYLTRDNTVRASAEEFER